MYVRDFESYKSRKKIPILLLFFYQYIIFSFIFSIIFSIIIPVKVNYKFDDLNQNSYYFIQTNLFFINFELERGDYIILNNENVRTEKIFFTRFVNLLTLNLLLSKTKYDIYEIIGTPHDIVVIKDGYLYINNKPYIKNYSTKLNRDQTFYLGENQYYCISTMKNSLDDSLLFGIVEKDKILGKLIKSFFIRFKK